MSDREILFQDLRTIQGLVEGDDPDQARQYIEDSYEGDERELLIKIFGLETISQESIF